MSEIPTQDDPIVQILRLAYRRGLAILQERERNAAAYQEHVPNDRPIENSDNDAIAESNGQEG